tara:strand:- start:1068 stop:1319 length:252 start_codon:yes stop_codon:yes gene_type:complete
MKIDTKNFNVKTLKYPDGSVQIKLEPKKCNCYGCSKQIEWAGANSILWIDAETNCRMQGRFCRECHQQLKLEAREYKTKGLIL